MKANVRVGADDKPSIFGASEDEMGIQRLPNYSWDQHMTGRNQRAKGFESLETVASLITNMGPQAWTSHTNFYNFKPYATIHSRDDGSNYINGATVDLNSFTNQDILTIATTLSNAYPKVADKYSAGFRWLQFAANLREYLNPDLLPVNEDVPAGSSPYGLYDSPARPYRIIGHHRMPLINEVTLQTTIRYLDFDPLDPSKFRFIVTNSVSVELANLWSDPPWSAAGGGYQIVLSRLPTLTVSNVVAGSFSEGKVIPWAISAGSQGGDSWVNIPVSGGMPSSTFRTFDRAIVAGGGATVFHASFPTQGYQGVALSRFPAVSIPIHVAFSNLNGSGRLIDYANIEFHVQQRGNAGTPILPASGGPPPEPNSSLAFTISSNKVIVAPGDPRLNHAPSLWAYSSVRTTNNWNRDSALGRVFQPETNTYAWQESNDFTQFFLEGGYFNRAGRISDPQVGPMESIAELGLLSTGFEDPAHMWTSLKLYGDGNKNPSVADSEDYMLLDYVRVTNSTARARLNFNTSKEFDAPGTGALKGAGVFRSLFLNAAIPTNADLKSGSDPSRNYQKVQFIESGPGRSLHYKIGSNIIAFAQASGPYRSIGHFLQRNSNDLSDATAMATPPPNNFEKQNTDWKREGILRSVVGHMTFRGHQFTVFSLGQSLRVVRGQTNVLAEAMMETIVERVPWSGGAQPVYYRPLYCRFLYE